MTTLARLRPENRPIAIAAASLVSDGAWSASNVASHASSSESRSSSGRNGLPLPGGGSRSLYAADGLVRGTERAERFLFWPMGIASAGAMRQWGHHATAFVGRRHFDDPNLLDVRFRLPLLPPP